MYEKAYEAAKMAVAEDCIIDSNPSLASEDFAVFGEIMPAFLYWVGSGTAGTENAMWHSVEFRIGEEYFKTAVPVLAASAMV
jgi:metal-dependent amidase/aminoacylase/carboxypeptidase family protein